jgi:hypothetical protein
LRRRLVTALYLTHVGKESNRLEEVEAGLVHDLDEVYTEYLNLAHDPSQTLVVPVLKQMPAQHIQQQAGMSLSQTKALRNGHARPRDTHREALIRVASGFARTQLADAGQPVLQRDLEACAALLAPRGQE